MYYVPIALAPRRREHESRDTRHDVFRRVRGSTSRLVSSNVSCLLSTPMVLASSLPQRRCVYMLEMRRVSPQHTRRDVTTQSASSRDDDSATSTQRLTARFAQHTKSLPNEPLTFIQGQVTLLCLAGWKNRKAGGRFVSLPLSYTNILHFHTTDYYHN
jgi:hypothetical protein